MVHLQLIFSARRALPLFGNCRDCWVSYQPWPRRRFPPQQGARWSGYSSSMGTEIGRRLSLLILDPRKVENCRVSLCDSFGCRPIYIATMSSQLGISKLTRRLDISASGAKLLRAGGPRSFSPASIAFRDTGGMCVAVSRPLTHCAEYKYE